MAADVLAMLLKMVVLVGLVIFTFGYPYSFLLLDIYGGKNLSGEDGKVYYHPCFLETSNFLPQDIGCYAHIVCMYCFLLSMVLPRVLCLP